MKKSIWIYQLRVEIFLEMKVISYFRILIHTVRNYIFISIHEAEASQVKKKKEKKTN